jgi:hypothetical protein
MDPGKENEGLVNGISIIFDRLQLKWGLISIFLNTIIEYRNI